MNVVIQTVTLGEDPKSFTSKDGKSVASFSGAVRKDFVKEGEPDANWFQYVAFGSNADFINKYIKKGNKIAIRGTLDNNNYEKDGVKHYSVKITIDKVESLTPKDKSDKPADSAASTSGTSTSSTPASTASFQEQYDEF